MDFIYVDKDNEGRGTLNRSKKNHFTGIKKLYIVMEKNCKKIESDI